MESRHKNLAQKLFDVGCVKFGCFTLKSGIQAPIYFDLRVIVSFPQILSDVADLMFEMLPEDKRNFSRICGVPYTALPIATCISLKQNIPMLIKRKEAKDYGTKKMVEGIFNKGDKCLIIEDVVTSGSSILETVQSLQTIGVEVTDAVVLLNREQGGEANITKNGITLHSVFTMSQIMDVLRETNKISPSTVSSVMQFISENQVLPPVTKKNTVIDKDNLTNSSVVKALSFQKRAELCKHPVAKKLFTCMAEKKTNLILSVDLTSVSEIIEAIEKIGPFVCAVKTHVDIIKDFNNDFPVMLTKLSEKHNFVIFEDRKFSDIGSTVQNQYAGGLFRICDWAHLVTVHPVPGYGVIEGLKDIGLPNGRACVLVAEMSSSGNLAKGDYTTEAVKMGAEHDDFVIGYVCQNNLTFDPKFIHMTPGVQLVPGKDNLGQQYLTPRVAICEHGSDAIIVGRGILKNPDPVEQAKLLRDAAYSAYEERM